MTRYARARGSKASNERMPEQATPWSVLKQQIEEQTLPNTKSKSATANNESNPRTTSKSTENKLWEEFDGHSKAISGENISYSKHSTKTKKLNLIEPDKLVFNNRKNSKLFVKTKGNRFVVNSINLNKQIETGCTNNVYKTLTDNIEITEENTDSVNVSNYKKEEPLEPVPKELLNQKQKKSKKSLKRKIIETEEENTLANSEKLDSVAHKKSTSFSGGKMERNNNTQFKANNQGSVKTNNASFQNRYKHFERARPPQTMFINGKKVEIKNFMGFPIRKEDAERLYDLRKELKLKGIPRAKIEGILHAERRNAEKSLARERKVVCFKCRKYGHNMADCSELGDPSGICFKCGSTEHSVNECRVVRGESFKFAHCFICKEEGHIARQCPDNPRGLYPKGGACKWCGSVTHLIKDCPDLVAEKERSSLTVGMVHNSCIEGLDEDLTVTNNKSVTKKSSHVKF